MREKSGAEPNRRFGRRGHIPTPTLFPSRARRLHKRSPLWRTSLSGDAALAVSESLRPGAPARVESIAATANCVYLLKNDRIFRAPLAREGKTESAAIPPTGGGRFVATCADGAIAGFHSSSQLLYVAPQFAVRAIPTQYHGVMCLEAIQAGMLCGVSGSGVVRLVSAQGQEFRRFVGHCAPVMKLTKLGLTNFASSADDGTVRVWDVRERFPVLTVTTNGVSVVDIAGSEETQWPQDYKAADLGYNRAEDMLAMIGIVEKETIRDSMMFVDNEGESRQRIFRVDEGFVGSSSV
jgi:hypothetical protein